MSNAILVTGGAGYIGSHVVRQLGERGERTVTLDDISTGFADAVLYGALDEGNTGDRELVLRLLDEHRVDTVMHFAARTIVPESVADPLRYYHNNTAATLNLLRCCREVGVRRFIFSSTAAVYGMPASGVCEEGDVTAPINPYGSSKLMSEWMLRDLSAPGDMDHVTLRYFNVAGCDPEQRIGQSTRKATLLTKVACEAAAGLREHVKIFGTDYDTPDGTGVRDYIHVEDLADAHLRALDYLRSGGESLTLNCGYGRGFSVREVIDAVGRAHGAPLAVVEEARRPGDPPMLIARAERIREVLHWTPRYDDLDAIVSTALAWEHKLKQLRQS